MTIQTAQHFSKRSQRMTHSAIRELLKLTEQPEFISFAGGLPAPEVLPSQAIAEAAACVLQVTSPHPLQYSTTEGFAPLRRYIAERLGEGFGPENILITSGSQQAIDLVGRLFLDEGDRVVVESPTYLALLQCWRAYGAEYLEVPSDDDGMRSDLLGDILRAHPKIIYTVPNFQNPGGVTMSLERRVRLIDEAARAHVLIVEDDPYRELRFEGEHLPRLLTLERDRTREEDARVYRGNVIGLGSFSKTLAPGLRVGWVVANPEIIDKLVLAKQSVDLHTATLTQAIAHHLVSTGFLEKHLQSIIHLYRTRRDAMVRSMKAHFPPGVRWTVPQGGMFLWVELPETLNATEVLQEALAQKVAFVPGTPFHAHGGHANTMRLNFSNSSIEKIEEGIERLAAVFRGHCSPSPAPRSKATAQRAVAAAEAVIDTTGTAG